MKKFILLLLVLSGLELAAQPPSNDAGELYERASNQSNLNQKWYYANLAVLADGAEYHKKYHLLRARTAVQLNKLDTAYICYQRMVQKEDNEHEVNHEFGVVCMRLNRLPEARDFLDRAVRKKSSNPQYRIDRGNLLNLPEYKEYDAAIFDFNKAIESERNSDWKNIMYQAYYGRGIAHLGKGKRENAASDFRKSLTLNPDATFKSKIFGGLAQLLYQMQQYQAAIDTFSKAIDINNQLHEAFDGRGLCYLATHEISNALADFSNALETARLKSYYYHRSLVYSRQQNYRAALSDLNAAITAIQSRVGDSAALPFYQRGFVLYHLKKYEEAKSDLTTAVQLQSDLADAYSYRGWAKIQIAQTTQLSEDFLRSLSDFNRAIQLQPNDAMAYCGRGLAQLYSNTSLEKAKQDLDKAINLNPKLAIAYLGRAKWHFKNTPEEAIRDLDQVIFLDNAEMQTEAYLLRAQLHFQLGHHAESETDYNFLVRNFPDSIVFTKQRGMTRFHLGKYAAGLEDLQAYGRAFPNDLETLWYVAQHQSGLNLFENAIHTLQKLLKIKPTHQMAANLLVKMQNALLEQERKIKKATVRWYTTGVWNDRTHISHYMDTTIPESRNLRLNGNIKSISRVAPIELKINGEQVQPRQIELSDGSYDFEITFQVEQIETKIELTIRNQAGDTTITRFVQKTLDKNRCNKQQGKLALVIGNRNYAKVQSLKNSVNDAQDIADSLRKIGFRVDTLYDGTFGQMHDAFERFADSVGNYELGFFYYSGHGIQGDNTNYLLPVEYDSVRALSLTAFSTWKMFEKIKNLRSKPCNLVVILDACRNGARPTGLNTAEMLPDNTIIGFAVDANQVAQDVCKGNDRNGLYTYYLLKYIKQMMRFDDILIKVKNEVTEEVRESNHSNNKEVTTEPQKIQTPIYTNKANPIYLCR